MRPVRAIALLMILFAAVSLTAQKRRTADSIRPNSVVRILFIGNSLTAANDLPAIVRRLAAAGGHEAVCESVVHGGYSLEDHAAEGSARHRIESGAWSVVVLQQGPSSLDSSRVNLREWTAKFAAWIRAAGARPALYAVWPEKERSWAFGRVSESYRLAADDVSGLFFPAGDAWLAAWNRDRALPLYGSDDFHPAATGSWLAALVIYRVLWGPLPARFSEPAFADDAAGSRLRLSETQLSILLAAADEAVAGAAD